MEQTAARKAPTWWALAGLFLATSILGGALRASLRHYGQITDAWVLVLVSSTLPLTLLVLITLRCWLRLPWAVALGWTAAWILLDVGSRWLAPFVFGA